MDRATGFDYGKACMKGGRMVAVFSSIFMSAGRRAESGLLSRRSVPSDEVRSIFGFSFSAADSLTQLFYRTLCMLIGRRRPGNVAHYGSPTSLFTISHYEIPLTHLSGFLFLVQRSIPSFSSGCIAAASGGFNTL